MLKSKDQPLAVLQTLELAQPLALHASPHCLSG
jgi:hypothetical protein